MAPLMERMARRVRLSHLRTGFTLVEMLVVLAIMALLLLAAAPLTLHWVHGAHTAEAKSKLALAYEQAKALALRNPCSAYGTLAAATLKAELKGTTVHLTVLAGDAASTAAHCPFLQARPNPQWQTDLPSGVALHIQGTALTSSQAVLVPLDSRSGPLQGHTISYKLSKSSVSHDEVGTLK